MFLKVDLRYIFIRIIQMETQFTAKRDCAVGSALCAVYGYDGSVGSFCSKGQLNFFWKEKSQ